jgi:GDPmannose 4,6-dehydratase
MFGESDDLAHHENSPFNPKNPYAATKVCSHQIAKIYRESYGLFIASGILFNHESERRPLRFVTQKVAYGAACASLGLINSPDLTENGTPIFVNNTLPMGNLEIYRDWGFAGDYVEAMWLMLQQDEPDDFIIATGELHSIQDLCYTAFACAGKDWRDYVVNDPEFTRPSDATKSHASIVKARDQLGWRPRLCFKSLVERMVVAQINSLRDKLAI